jgi:hypothetical protein
VVGDPTQLRLALGAPAGALRGRHHLPVKAPLRAVRGRPVH